MVRTRKWWRPWLKALLVLGYFGTLVAVAFVPFTVLMGLARLEWVADPDPWRTPAHVGGVLLAVLAVLTVGRVDLSAQGRALAALKRWAASRHLTAGGSIGIAYARDARRGTAYGSAPELVHVERPVRPFDRRGSARALLARSRPVAPGTLSLVVYRVEWPLVHDAEDEGKVDTTLLLLHGLGDLPVATIAPRGAADRVSGELGVAGGGDVLVESADFNARRRVEATDVRAAHAMLTPTFIERLLAPDAHGFTVTTLPGALMVAFDELWPGADALDRAAAVLEGTAAALPAHLR